MKKEEIAERMKRKGDSSFTPSQKSQRRKYSKWLKQGGEGEHPFHKTTHQNPYSTK